MGPKKVGGHASTNGNFLKCSTFHVVFVFNASYHEVLSVLGSICPLAGPVYHSSRRRAAYSSSSSSFVSRVVHVPSSDLTSSSSSSKETPDPSRVLTLRDHAFGSARPTASTMGVCG